MSENGESSLREQFAYCENVIEDLFRGRLGDSKSQQMNDKLRNCIERLQIMQKTIESLSLFSTNDQAEELPTNSLRYLLVPAYFAYVLHEINFGTDKDKRTIYLNSAKASYRAFLQNLFTYGLINFKLPWIDGEENTSKTRPHENNFEHMSLQRQQKISRLRQMEKLESALEKLRVQERRDDDESAMREVVLVLLRLWSIRAVKELDSIDDELRLLEQAKSACFSNESSINLKENSKFTPFILTRTEQQKKVFGLGYPSIPTMSVNDWFDDMQRTGGFGNINKRNIVQSHDHEESDEEDDMKRQSKIRMDEWKDINPRGWGNTLNKG